MTFAERFGYVRPLPPRVRVECDSDGLRVVLWNFVSQSGRDSLAAYRSLCQHANQLPDSNVWSAKFADAPARVLLTEMSWIDVYEALEAEYANAGAKEQVRLHADVNSELARAGIACEMVNGRFELHDPVAVEMQTQHDEDAALALLTDEFHPVRKQYGSALQRLRGVSPDFEGAVADAVNALEAVTRLVLGSSSGTLSSLVSKLFPDSPGYHEPLRQAITKMYAYANELPGARHGRYAEPLVAYAETALVVRSVGAIVTFLIAQHTESSGVVDTSGPDKLPWEQ